MKLVDRLANQFAISKKKAKALLDRRVVFVNDRRVWIASFEVSDADRIEAADRVPEKRGIPVLFRDPHILVADKPAGMLSVGAGSAELLLRREPGPASLAACHRLDRDTSGAIAFARSSETLDRMITLFRKHKVGKTYLGLVQGRVRFGEKDVDLDLEGRRSFSRFRLIEASATASLLEIGIETGRTHQIRRHLQELGLRLVGEKRYGTAVVRGEFQRSAGRQMLHAWKLAFPHPVLESGVSVTAPPAEDLVRLCRMAGLKTDLSGLYSDPPPLSKEPII